jgi:predicted transcriptional regulator of viral defense system
MTRQLELIDTLLSEGRDEFTFEDAKAHLGVSPEATANALARLSKNGLVDKLARGHYAIRPFGALGTSAATEDLGFAVGAAFEGREHRIAYLSALSELGVLSHPVRTIYVACTERVRFSTLSRRPLRLVAEKPETIHLEAEAVKNSWRSSLERALFECALRVDLVGSVERLAQAVASGSRDADSARIARLATAFGTRGQAAQRRLASMATTLQLPLTLSPEVGKRQPVIRLDPRDDRIAWTDTRLWVAWNTTIDELQAIVGN